MIDDASMMIQANTTSSTSSTTVMREICGKQSVTVTVKICDQVTIMWLRRHLFFPFKYKSKF
jgi:hypothetical protein